MAEKKKTKKTVKAKKPELSPEVVKSVAKNIANKALPTETTETLAPAPSAQPKVAEAVPIDKALPSPSRHNSSGCSWLK